MKKNNSYLWTYYIQMILGVWLFASPATFSYESLVLTVSDWICGVFLILFGWWGRRNGYWNWALLLVGVWLQAAPLLFWAPTAAAYVNNTLLGAIVIALSFLVVDPPGTEPDSGPALPPGWSYNPSSWAQRLPIAALALFCWMISRYLAAYQLGYIAEVWDPFFDPGTKNVLTSSVSKAFPVSDAGLGALAYTFEFITTCQGGVRRWRTSPWMVLIFGILVIPVSITSVILIILQPLVVGSWCTLCLINAVFMLIGIPWAIDEIFLIYQYLRAQPKGKRWETFFLGGECKGATNDLRSPPMDASFSTIWKASLWGMTFPFNLWLCVLFGFSLMIFPQIVVLPSILSSLDLILGAFGIVVAIISFAEHTRAARFLNLLFVAALLVTTVIYWTCLERSTLACQLALPILLGLFSLRRGSIKERSSLSN